MGRLRPPWRAGPRRRAVGDAEPATDHPGRVFAGLSGLREPVIVILFLIGFFTLITGKPLDGVFLLLVAVGLAWDAGNRTRTRATVAAGTAGAGTAGAGTAAAPKSSPAPAVGYRRALLIVSGLASAALYAAVVGSFTPYSWPATVAVVGLGGVVVAVGWRGPLTRRPAQSRLALPGAALWGALLVAGGLWELGALLQQPDLTTKSFAHPTISTLTDPLLGSHGNRSVLLGVWLAIGWFLVRR